MTTLSSTEGRVAATVIGLVLLCLVTACAPDSDEGRYEVERLPSLVGERGLPHRVVEVDTTAGPQERWSLDTLVVIGSSEKTNQGNAPVFTRISDVRLLDGDLWGVVDPSAFRVELFDMNGRLAAVLGGPGDGPGEFRLLSRVRECEEDGYFVLDDSKTVMKVFNTDGSHRDEYRVFGYNPNQPFWSWDCSDGHVLTMQWGDGDPREGEVGRFRKQVPLALASPDGTVVTPLGRILGPERYRFQNRGTGPAPLGVVTGLAVRDETVYVAEGPQIRIDALSFSGEHLWTLVAPSQPRPIETRAFIDAQRPAEMTDDERRAFNLRWRDWDFPEALPAFRGFIVDDKGLLWVERYPAVGDAINKWWVYEPDGTWRATVSVPPNVELTDVEAGRVAGVIRYSLGVEGAGVFELKATR